MFVGSYYNARNTNYVGAYREEPLFRRSLATREYSSLFAGYGGVLGVLGSAGSPVEEVPIYPMSFGTWRLRNIL